MLADTKQLLEGSGKALNIKFEKGYVGFINAFTLITCNNKPYPFVEPNSSQQNISRDDWLRDRDALNARCTIFEMTKTYARDVGTFPIP